MIKILVNAPKGGVGKTTLSTNIALLLARKGHKVWALDLAQGEQMTKYLSRTPEFGAQTGNIIETRELETIPTNFPGASNFDFLVADTDDYYKIIADLSDAGVSRGWRIIVPIINEYNGLERIPEEISALMMARLFNGADRLNMKIFANNVVEVTTDSVNILEALKQRGIDNLFGAAFIPHCQSAPPYFINDPDFCEKLQELLEEMGIE